MEESLGGPFQSAKVKYPHTRPAEKAKQRTRRRYPSKKKTRFCTRFAVQGGFSCVVVLFLVVANAKQRAHEREASQANKEHEKAQTKQRTNRIQSGKQTRNRGGDLRPREKAAVSIRKSGSTERRTKEADRRLLRVVSTVCATFVKKTITTPKRSFLPMERKDAEQR